jgi:protein TonB
VIEIVEDEEEIEETVIESTETDQDEEIEVEDIEVEEVYEDVEVPFSVIENVPEYPGCEKGSNTEKRKCMSAKIAKFVQRKFNTDLAGDLGLSGRQRISVIFKIDKTGNVTGVRSRAPHPRLEKEAARVINMLPKMKPGRQRGKAVVVPYSLPITFQVQD